MSTPAFTPQTQDSLTPIRFYTPFDPYFYTVDNRPLQDIAANLLSVSAVGGDSARRAVLLAQMAMSSSFSSAFPSNGGVGYLDGMQVSLSSGVLSIGPGAMYFSDVVNTESSVVVTKQALLPAGVSFSLTTPNAALGNAKDYLVQVRVANVTPENTPSSQLPFLDASNGMLPGLVLNAEAVVTIKEGVSGPYGSQVTPTVDSGCIPLYVVTYALAPAYSNVKVHSQAPAVKTGMSATSLTSSNVLAGGTTSSVNVPVSFTGGDFNPLLPIKVRAMYSSSTGGGNAVLQVNYSAVSVGGNTTATTTSAGRVTVALPSTAHSLVSLDLPPSIPVAAFSGFVGSTWGISKSVLLLSVSRIGGDSMDTSSGDITVLEVQAYQ